MLVKDWAFTFAGYDASRIPNINTFAENTQTNNDANYNFSLVIPQGTSSLVFAPIGFVEKGGLSEKTLIYKIFFERDGKYIPFNSSAPNPTRGSSSKSAKKSLFKLNISFVMCNFRLCV